MRTDVPPHEKIRFRRVDIADLDRLPSALPPRRVPRAWQAVRRGAARLALGAVLTLGVVMALGYAVLVSGLGEERLRLQAQTAVSALLGEGFDARIGGVSVSLDGMRVVALDVSDVRIAATETGAEIMRVGSARFALRFLPLMRGEVRLGGVRVGDTRVELAALPGPRGQLRLPFVDEAGLVDPDAAVAAFFDAARSLFSKVGEHGIRRVRFDAVEIVLPAAAPFDRLHVARASLRRDRSGALGLDATVEMAGRAASLTGRASRDPETGAVDALSLQLDAPAEAGLAFAGHSIGPVHLSLDGYGSGPRRIVTAAARVGDSEFAFGGERLRLDVGLAARARGGGGRLEIDALRVGSGRSAWNFQGTVARATDPAVPAYRFELVSDGSVVAPDGSPEPEMTVAGRVAGRLGADARLLRLDEIAFRSPHGTVGGKAALRLGAAGAPGIDLDLEIAGMPVAEATQLWPWFAARGARDWALANIHGGHVESGRLVLAVAPSRLGDGVPLGGGELSGRFAVSGAHFDVGGTMPPVRDAHGTLDLDGRNVEIALAGGRMALSGGRAVEGREGTLSIRGAEGGPLVGRLRVAVAGGADALLELAGRQPIDAGRFIDIAPGDVSGRVRGTVVADIPLQRGIAPESLDWRVDLDYEDVALAKPFQGQRVSAATGSLSVDPRKAAIKGRAELNGMPATLDIVEPLGGQGGEGRQRRIALQMDDAARRAIAPGLDMLVTGTTRVELDERAAQSPAVKASLDLATLNIPWLGWSKGTGVPAEVAFAMATRGERIDLSDFRLSGDTFGASGALSFVGGEMTRARFPSARLNRSDDFSFDMEAKGRGYAITVRGARIDARSIIKLYSRDAGGGTASGGEARPMSIDLQVAAMTGFNGETLHDVRLAYAGAGSRIDRLSFSAVTASGAPVTFRDGRADGNRTISIRTEDAGAVLRFLDLYDRMEGGDFRLSLSAEGDGPLAGSVRVNDFWLVNEPRLRSIVSTPPGDDGRSLNDAVRGRIDTQRVRFERAFARVVKGTGTLSLDRGILRGPLVGATFQGSLYDRHDNMAMTGTLMPAYGFNRLFAEIPLIGRVLGNGRDRGLIGITFRLSGKASEPHLQINPLSVIAPGIFRSVFEFR